MQGSNERLYSEKAKISGISDIQTMYARCELFLDRSDIEIEKNGDRHKGGHFNHHDDEREDAHPMDGFGHGGFAPAAELRRDFQILFRFLFVGHTQEIISLKGWENIGLLNKKQEKSNYVY